MKCAVICIQNKVSGCRTYTRIKAMEMWIRRRTEKIDGTDHISNDEVLQRVDENDS